MFEWHGGIDTGAEIDLRAGDPELAHLRLYRGVVEGPEIAAGAGAARGPFTAQFLAQLVVPVFFADEEDLTRRQQHAAMYFAQILGEGGQCSRIVHLFVEFLQRLDAVQTTQAMADCGDRAVTAARRRHGEGMPMAGDALFHARAFLGQQFAQSRQFIEAGRFQRFPHQMGESVVLVGERLAGENEMRADVLHFVDAAAHGGECADTAA